MEFDFNLIVEFLIIFSIGLSGGLFSYRLGKKSGWDDLAYQLAYLSIIDIDEDGEIIRVSDKEYRKVQRELNEIG